jgi:hypothetical protein
MWLVANGETHPVAQAAPEFVILAKSATIPAGPATLLVEIEGNEDQSPLQVLGPDASYPHRIRITRAK